MSEIISSPEIKSNELIVAQILSLGHQVSEMEHTMSILAQELESRGTNVEIELEKRNIDENIDAQRASS